MMFCCILVSAFCWLKYGMYGDGQDEKRSADKEDTVDVVTNNWLRVA